MFAASAAGPGVEFPELALLSLNCLAFFGYKKIGTRMGTDIPNSPRRLGREEF
jgi:hypothetical protein